MISWRCGLGAALILACSAPEAGHLHGEVVSGEDAPVPAAIDIVRSEQDAVPAADAVPLDAVEATPDASELRPDAPEEGLADAETPDTVDLREIDQPPDSVRIPDVLLTDQGGPSVHDSDAQDAGEPPDASSKDVCAGAGGTACPVSAICMASYCVAGQCFEDAQLFCTDDDPCTVDYCDPISGACGHVQQHEPPCDTPEPCASATECDDGNSCTFDTCETICVHEIVPCTTEDACITGACDASPFSGSFGKCHFGQKPCDDDDLCTIDSCDPTAGCTHAAKLCDDANDCTVDACDSTTGLCVHYTLGCCGGQSACIVAIPGKCAGYPKDCSDDDLCTIDTCSEPEGCLSVPRVCFDGDACTADACSPATGMCVATAVYCDHGDPCTIDLCDGDTGSCSHDDGCSD